MKRILLLLIVLIGTSASTLAQEASVDYWRKGHGMTFLLKSEDVKCMIYFPPKGNYVEMEMILYAKSSEKSNLVFTPIIKDGRIELYVKDKVYFGHIMFHNDNAYVYDTKGQFLFKAPRWSPGQ